MLFVSEIVLVLRQNWKPPMHGTGTNEEVGIRTLYPLASAEVEKSGSKNIDFRGNVMVSKGRKFF